MCGGGGNYGQVAEREQAPMPDMSNFIRRNEYTRYGINALGEYNPAYDRMP